MFAVVKPTTQSELTRSRLEFDDVAVEITPHRWRSWSSEKLIAASKDAAPDLPPDQWFVPES